jgi:outer membrane protein OmpA-like peptidoglycan-associated protein
MKKIFTAAVAFIAFSAFSQAYIDPGIGITLQKNDVYTPYRVNAGLHNIIGNRLGFYATAEFGTGAGSAKYFRDIEGGMIRLTKVVSLYGGVGLFSKGIIENGLKIDGVRKEVGLDFLIKKLHLNIDVGYSVSRGVTTNFGYVIPFKKKSEPGRKAKDYNIPLAEKVKQPTPPEPQPPAVEKDSAKMEVLKVETETNEKPLSPVIQEEEKEPMQQVVTLLKGEDVKFGFGKTQIDPSYIPKLKELTIFLSKNPQFNLIIYGHACDIGTTQVNDAVSLRRAEAAKRYLVAGGIDPSRITAKGMGERSPLVPNNDPASRMKNRRIEFEKVEVKK